MAERIDSLSQSKRQAEQERDWLRLRHEELKAELTVLQGRYESDVLSLRAAAVGAEEARRQQEAADEQQRRRESSLSLSLQQLQADLALSSKQLQHAQTELSWYRERLRELETRGRQEGEDVQRQQAAVRLRAEEAEALRTEAERLRAERLRLLDEAQSLSLTVHALQQEGEDKDERLQQLSVELQLSRQQLDARQREQDGQQQQAAGRDEAERIIGTQRQQLELVKRELSAAYESLRSVRKEKGDMYEMLKVCDLQLVRVQLAVQQMEQERDDRQREVQQQQEQRQSTQQLLDRERQDRLAAGGGEGGDADTEGRGRRGAAGGAAPAVAAAAGAGRRPAADGQGQAGEGAPRARDGARAQARGGRHQQILGGRERANTRLHTVYQQAKGPERINKYSYAHSESRPTLALL